MAASVSSLVALKVFAGAILALFSLRTSVGIAAWRSANRLERPRYSVVGAYGGVELRKYSPYIVAEVRSNSDSMKKATSSGFRQVAGYIFGKNKERSKSFFSKSDTPRKMRMTAPVRTEMNSNVPAKKSGEYSLSFVMSSDYSLNNLPVPLNRNVTLRKIPEHYLAVKKFSGPPPTEDKVTKYRDEIVQTLAEKGIAAAREAKDKTYLYQYHDPFATPNFLRKNEVGIPISEKAATTLASSK